MARRNAGYLLLLANILVLAAGFFFINLKVKQYLKRPHLHPKTDGRLRKINDSLESLHIGAFHDMVDRVVEGATGEQEQCIRLARYFATNIRNYLRDDAGKTELEWWAVRSGLCGTRSLLMVRALRRLGIVAKTWHIYDYGFGHVCVQAYYGGAWHFFDPTYGGYFIGEDNYVLSWDEIVANPQAAVENMVVSPDTLDRDGGAKWPRVDNNKKMRSTYAPAAIAKVRSAGFSRGRVFTIPVILQFPEDKSQKFSIGKIDGHFEDMLTLEVFYAARCYYLRSLGNQSENFLFEIHLKGLSDKKPIRISFHFCGAKHGKARLLASSQTGTIKEGNSGPICGEIDVNKGDSWSILYEPEDLMDNTIRISLSSYEGAISYCELDAIIVETVP